MTMRTASGTNCRRKQRTHYWAELYSIHRADGSALYFTSHDEPVQRGGNTYTPVASPGASNERRESGVKDANLQLFGAITDDAITHDDLAAGRYDGSRLEQMVVDWRRPEMEPIYSARKFVVKVRRTGSTWTADIVGLTKYLTQPSGGRFGGHFDATCPYVLGDESTCKKDISALVRNSSVATIQDERDRFRGDSGTWTGSFADDYFAGGQILWTSGDNEGAVSPIYSYQHSNREVRLLLPLPFPIQVGDTFEVKPGCDGTLITCRDKFSNEDNFGGSPFNPGATKALEAQRD